MTAPRPTSEMVAQLADLMRRAVLAEHDDAIEAAAAERWQILAGRYEEIRYALRNAPDTPAGWRKFYDECSEIIDVKIGADLETSCQFHVAWHNATLRIVDEAGNPIQPGINRLPP